MLLKSNMFLIGLVIAANVIGQLMFKVAANQVKNENTLQDMVIKLLTNPAAWGAVLLYALMVIAWIWVLRVLPLSLAYSSIALVFVFVPLFGSILFNEPLSIKFFIGMTCIVAGVWLIHN
jgi:undecaprenyl phosphate-alpha-L-ara4N flippase subunit ArnE|tara:strand:- start:239 stop:598 length:360 start_codon:yes stop_codon:yes gene_type:complete